MSEGIIPWRDGAAGMNGGGGARIDEEKSPMSKMFLRGRYFVLWASSGTLLALGGCGLNDQQLTGILSSVITSALTSLVSLLVGGLGSALTNTGA